MWVNVEVLKVSLTNEWRFYLSFYSRITEGYAGLDMKSDFEVSRGPGFIKALKVFYVLRSIFYCINPGPLGNLPLLTSHPV